MVLRLSHLTVIKQKHNDLVADYIRKFRYTRNQCFKLNIFDKDLITGKLGTFLGEVIFLGIEKYNGTIFLFTKMEEGTWN
jgi:hypothetical protein